MSADQRHGVGVEELAIDTKCTAVDTFHGKAEALVEGLGVCVVSSDRKFNAGKALCPSLRNDIRRWAR